MARPEVAGGLGAGISWQFASEAYSVRKIIVAKKMSQQKTAEFHVSLSGLDLSSRNMPRSKLPFAGLSLSSLPGWIFRAIVLSPLGENQGYWRRRRSGRRESPDMLSRASSGGPQAD